MPAPYVLTDDLPQVFAESVTPDNETVVADALAHASDSIVWQLGSVFKKVERIPSYRIMSYLQSATEAADVPVLSLTSLMPGNGANVMSVESSRTVTIDGVGSMGFRDVGLCPRFPDAPPLREQFCRIAGQLKAMGADRVDVVDDVIFTGGTILGAAEVLAQSGISVRYAAASVVINRAVDALAQVGIRAKADAFYPAVIDEVCMRDLIVGAPGGGRNLLRDDGSMSSIPYINPFGDITAWASIEEEDAPQFSKVCLTAARNIWAAANPAQIFADLRRPVVHCDPGEVIMDRINRMLESKAYIGRYTY